MDRISFFFILHLGGFSVCTFRLPQTQPNFNQYCIVGAGPSGLQMGYFLQKAKRDYIIFDRENKSGSFFEKYPRHRTLISINKRFTGRSNKEFNLRHDWNSLISDREDLLFTRYSKDYFPHADELVLYLNDYQRKMQLNVQYNSQVTNIQRSPENDTKNTCSYQFNISDMNSGFEKQRCCEYLIMANGIEVPHIPKLKGVHFTEGCENVSIDPHLFEGQKVLIMGRGNSGLELAKEIYRHTAALFLVGRSRIRFSWETHYVGDARGVNTEIYDSYMLKSLDGAFESDITHLELIKTSKGKLDFRYAINKQIRLAENFPLREGVDRVIRCLGFQYNQSAFHNDTLPKLMEEKFPTISQDYSSTQFKDMYFAGPLTHSLDYRKSAGGFIHGFRYTIRALHRLLEYKNHEHKWPYSRKPLKQLAPTLLKRANEGSGIYQMFTTLVDVAIYNTYTKMFTYIEELPVKLLPDITSKTGHLIDPMNDYIFILSMEYGGNYSKPGIDRFHKRRAVSSARHAHRSNFLHPVVYLYRSLPNGNVLIKIII